MEKRAGGLKEKVLHVPIVGSAIFAAYSLLLPYFPMLSPVLGALPRVLLWIRGLQRWVVIPTNVAVFATNAIRKFAPVVRAVRFWPSVVAGAQRGAQAAVAFCSRVAVTRHFHFHDVTHTRDKRGSTNNKQSEANRRRTKTVFCVYIARALRALLNRKRDN